jgi:hypothetical protein
MKMGNANGDDKVNHGGTSKACADLVAEGCFAAMGVGNHEKSLLPVDGTGRSLWADACARTRLVPGHLNQER